MALPSSQDQSEIPMERWRLWLGRILIIPLIAMSGGIVFALYRVLVSGEINTVSRGYRVTSRVYYFAESPVMFLVAFAFHAALAGLIIFVTVFVVRRVIKGTRPV